MMVEKVISSMMISSMMVSSMMTTEEEANEIKHLLIIPHI